jgi:Zn-dependent protease
VICKTQAMDMTQEVKMLTLALDRSNRKGSSRLAVRALEAHQDANTLRNTEKVCYSFVFSQSSRSAARVDFIQKIDIATVLIQFAVLLFSLSIHEASHAWTADHFGDYTARYLGRVTLNPVAHIDPIGTLLFPIIAIVTGLPVIGWAKPVPVNSVHLSNPRRDQIYISLAGPASNLLAAAAAFAFLAAIKFTSTHAGALVDNMVITMRIPGEKSALAPILGMLFFITLINLALALFNFIPIPPLDGHWVLYGLLPYGAAQIMDRMSSYGILILWGMMLFGAFNFIFRWSRDVLGLLYYL